jgi:FkbM family methyltransferase
VEVLGGALRGARLFVDLASEKYYWLGTHEPRVQALLQREMRAGDVAWDIGAHIGFFTVLMARRAGPDGRVYAFEPVDRNAVRLEENVEANALHNVVICPAAVGDTNGFVSFSDGATSLEGRIDETGGMRVECVTIDSAVEAGCLPPTLMKVDVEGAEAAVIRGAAATIATYGPRMLIEIHSAVAGAAVADAMPVPYVFADLATRRVVEPPFPAGHYFAVPAEGAA